MPVPDPPPTAALEALRPMLRRLADQLVPGVEPTDLGTTTTDCASAGLVFNSWQISIEAASGTGADLLDRARELFAGAGYTKGHENLDYELGPDVVWLDEASDTQLHAIGYRDSARLDLIIDGPCGPAGDEDTTTGNPLAGDTSD